MHAHGGNLKKSYILYFVVMVLPFHHNYLYNYSDRSIDLHIWEIDFGLNYEYDQ